MLNKILKNFPGLEKKCCRIIEGENEQALGNNAVLSGISALEILLASQSRHLENEIFYIPTRHLRMMTKSYIVLRD